MIWDDSIFLLFLVCNADLGMLSGRLFSQHLKFYSFMFLHKISTGLSVLMASNLMTFWNLFLGNLSLSSGVKLLGETMVQTDATLLANNSQHCWMLHVASVCTPCCMLLNVVGQSLKPVKLLAPGKRTKYCFVRLQLALKSTP